MTAVDVLDRDYWYTNRHELRQGMVFIDYAGDVVRLDRGVPGDGTRWYVDSWYGYWAHDDSTAEPGDLVGNPIEDSPEAITAALAACRGGK